MNEAVEKLKISEKRNVALQGKFDVLEKHVQTIEQMNVVKHIESLNEEKRLENVNRVEKEN